MSDLVSGLDQGRAQALVMAGAGLSVVGDGVFLTGLAWSVLSTTGSAVQLSTVMGALSVVLILATPLTGQILDWKRGPNWLVGSEYLAATALFAAVAFLTAYKPGFAFFLALGLLVNLFSSLSGPALPIMLARMSSPEALPRAMARSEVASRAGRIGGPLIGGALVGIGDFRLCCAVNAVSYLVSGSCWLAARSRLARSTDTGAQVGTSRTSRVTAGARYVWHDSYLRGLILVALVANTSISFTTVTVPLLVYGPLHGGSGTYGLMQATFQGGILLASVVFSMRPLPSAMLSGRRGLGSSLLGLGLSFVLMGLSPTIPLAVGAILLAGIWLSVTSLITDTKLVTDVPAEVRGRVLGMVSSAFGSLRPAGTFAGGAVAGAVGVAFATVGGGVALALAGLYYQLPRSRPAAATVGLPTGAGSRIEPADLEQ